MCARHVRAARARHAHEGIFEKKTPDIINYFN